MTDKPDIVNKIQTAEEAERDAARKEQITLWLVADAIKRAKVKRAAADQHDDAMRIGALERALGEET